MIPLLESDIDDLELMGLISGGDRDAFRMFYERHGGRLLGYLRRLGARNTEADDLLQEIFLSVWRRANTFDATRGEVGGWLFTIARNKWFDWLRSTGRRPTQPLVIDVPLVEPSTSPETDLSIAQALKRLKREQREALELAYFGGFTYQETATHLSLPLGTLKSRVKVGLQSLRNILETR